MILVDSNVWIDVIQRDPTWLDWSLEQRAIAARSHELAINAIVVAELAPNFESSHELADFVKRTKAKTLALSNECSFLAGHARLKYRQKKRTSKTPIVGVLAEFFIGALPKRRTNFTLSSAGYGRSGGNGET
jgi:predicted nucleic acid-binding protein